MLLDVTFQTNFKNMNICEDLEINSVLDVPLSSSAIQFQLLQNVTLVNFYPLSLSALTKVNLLASTFKELNKIHPFLLFP